MADEKELFLHRKAWQESFQGWNIVDCAIRNRDFVYLILRKDIPPEQISLTWDHDVPSRLAVLYLNETDPQEKWGHQDLEGFLLTFGGASLTPTAQGLALSANGDVFASGSGKSGMEKVLPEGGTISLRKCRTIAGRSHAVGYARGVYRRMDIGRWERLAHGLPDLDVASMPADELTDFGFEDIDGFAENDLYAVGGKGDVWHYDGKIWIPCEFPANWPLLTVCCAGDGQVYISGEGGSLWKGRGDTWTQIWKNEYTLPYNDARWYEGKLWLSSDYMFDQWTGSAIEHVHHAGKRVDARGHMDVGDGILVVAEANRVSLFDGADWRTLVAPYR